MSFNSNKILVLVPLLALLAIPTIAWTRYPLYDNQLYDYTRPEVLYPNKGPYSTNLGDPEDFRSHVFEICRYNFAGAWNLITPDQMRFFELKRSIKDRWYYCGLPFNVRPLYREYGEAAVIFYGPGRRHPEDTTAAATVSAYFSQKQAQQFSTLLTPRILGTFPGGRIEEYWLVVIKGMEFHHSVWLCSKAGQSCGPQTRRPLHCRRRGPQIGIHSWLESTRSAIYRPLLAQNCDASGIHQKRSDERQRGSPFAAAEG